MLIIILFILCSLASSFLLHLPKIVATASGGTNKVASSSNTMSLSNRNFNEKHIKQLLKNEYFSTERLTKAKDITNFEINHSEITTAKRNVKCYCVSDLHADSDANQLWVRDHCQRSPLDSDTFTVFICPGDIGSDIDRISSVLSLLIQNYDAVCYVPGNHEAWRRGGAAKQSGADSHMLASPETKTESASSGSRVCDNSIEKLGEVLDCARSLGVHVGPLRISCSSGEGCNLVVFPLYSWYHSSWDTEPNITHSSAVRAEQAFPFSRRWSDFSMCSWPPEWQSHEDFVRNAGDNTLLAEAFATLNEPFLHPLPNSVDLTACNELLASGVSLEDSLGRYIGSPLVREGDSVVSFSHFLPRQELCIEKQFLMEAGLSKVIGSDALDAQISRLQPHLHLFGHTHIPLDLDLDGQRYIQWPLGYRRESEMQCAPIFSSGPLLVFDSAVGTGAAGIPPDIASQHTHWSKHYRKHKRDPSQVNDLAPWVCKRLDAFGFS